MKLSVTHKMIAGYIMVFLLLSAFATLTYVNGKKIEATTITLAQEKIPGLIAASAFKNNTQLQTIHLYELYATADLTLFNKRHQMNMASTEKSLSELQSLPEFTNHNDEILALNKKQDSLTEQFVNVMRANVVDWDQARNVLLQFSKGADSISAELDHLVQSITNETIARSNASQKLTEQLINLVLLLTAITFIGILCVVYYGNHQVAQPLRALSASLGAVVARRDLTYRIKQKNNDEIGDITVAANNLLDEFQAMARTLDATSQELNRTMTNLTGVTEDTKQSMVERNSKLRSATQSFMNDIINTQVASDESDKRTPLDTELHRAQMKFVELHLNDIEQGTHATERSVKSLQQATVKLQKLTDAMHNQIRLFNF